MNQADQFSPDLALWIIRLSVEDPELRRNAQMEFEAWKQQHPEYQGQLDQMLTFSEEIQQLPNTHRISSQTISHSLETSQQSRQRVHRWFAKTTVFCIGLVVAGGVGYISLEQRPFAYYAADFKTGTGQQQRFILEDGSQLILGAKSAVNLRFDDTVRQIDLVQGELYIEVAKDPQRPLSVHTSQADFKALGTKFIVNQYASMSTISMLHSKVEVRSRRAVASRAIVQQGQKITADEHGLGTIEWIDTASAELAWQQHQILAEDLPLSDLLSRLNREHDAMIWFSTAELDGLKISGVINTQQDINQILDLLVQQYPTLKLRRFGQSMVHISREG